MTSPGPSISPPPAGTLNGLNQPQPRRFGSATTTTTTNLRSPPRSTSNTPRSSTPTLVPPPVEPRRTRSSSSASLVSQDGSEAAGNNNSFGKAQAWLSTWAPRGEGRTREFLAHTVNGVASVASTVSSGIGGTVNTLEQRAGLGNRPNSFHAVQDTQAQALAQAQIAAGPTGSPGPSVAGGGLRQVISPPGPVHTASTPVMPASQMAKRPPQPANSSRLAPVRSPSPPPATAHRPSLSMSNSSTSSSSTLQAGPSTSNHASRSNSTSNPNATPHGPSHLNPNPKSRGSFSHPLPAPNHVRSPSMGYNPSSSPTPSRSSSTANGIWKGAGMPYKLGFQPAGVKNDRTSEFQNDRKRMAEEREKEEGRLGRRWAKLVDLHFNPSAINTLPSLPRSSSSSSNLTLNDKRRSILSIDGALDAMKAKDMWYGLKGVANPPDQQEAARKRAVEQSIVKWEDDAEVRKCRICLSSFSISNRKHHCRVCGRIVCSLPPTPSTLLAVQIQLFSPTDGSLPPGTRRDKCSLLLVADHKTGRGEEVEEGFVGWMKLEDESKGKVKGKRRKDVNADGVEGQPQEVQVKGVRVCRECWSTVSRKQKMADRERPTGFGRLYQTIRLLQRTVEDVMPEFEEQMELLVSDMPNGNGDKGGAPPDPPTELIKTHKELLALLGQYEVLSKRLSNLPCPEGGNQATVQSAVARASATFLTKEMLKLQALPRYQKRLAEVKRDHMTILQTTLADQLKLRGVEEDAAEDVAVILQPLLEQEAQLESYIADANAQRKYEDGKALSEALGEIRSEIAKITNGVK